VISQRRRDQSRLNVNRARKNAFNFSTRTKSLSQEFDGAEEERYLVRGGFWSVRAMYRVFFDLEQFLAKPFAAVLKEQQPRRNLLGRIAKSGVKHFLDHRR
jgi:hypothetical protein